MVLKALSHGHSTATIAADLGLVPGTVGVHVEAIRRKLHATFRLAAVTAAIRYGIVEGPRA
jgi:DNA-binding NarL/FixJ family response regulator